MPRAILIATSLLVLASTAGADHRHRSDAPLLYAAEALAYATDRARDAAGHETYDRCDRDGLRRAAKALRKLDERARRFAERVDRTARDHNDRCDRCDHRDRCDHHDQRKREKKIDKELRKLLDRYYDAWHAVHDLRDARHVRRSFLRVQRAMDRLLELRGGWGAYPHGGCGHGHSLHHDDRYGRHGDDRYRHRGESSARYRSERTRGGVGGWFRWPW